MTKTKLHSKSLLFRIHLYAVLVHKAELTINRRAHLYIEQPVITAMQILVKNNHVSKVYPSFYL